MITAILQAGSLDPASYATSWGVLGALVFVIVVLGGIIYSLFVKGEAHRTARDAVLMDFVDRHRGQMTEAMSNVASTLAQSNKEMSVVVSQSYEALRLQMSRQTRALDEVLLTSRILDQIAKAKREGVELTEAEVDRVVRSVMHERNLDSTRGGGG